MINNKKSFHVYVGTYTTIGKSKGIYQYKLDPSTGNLQFIDEIDGIENPSYLAIHPNNQYLYAVNEVTEFQGTSSGYVSSFAIDRATGKLRLINKQPSLGSLPCHISIAGKNFALVANYMGGNATVLPILDDGSLDKPTSTMQHQGSSVDSERQEAPHAHCVISDEHNHVFVADLGIDKVMIHRLDTDTGQLTRNEVPWVKVHPGAGPRQITIHPNEKFAYLINELDSTITAFDYQPNKGCLVEFQTISTLPSEFPAAGNTGADIEIHPSGRFLYGSNRGHNSIAIFEIDQTTGELTLVGHEPTQGDAPRFFSIDPSGFLMLVANQNTNNIVSFTIEANSGKLRPTGHATEVPNPVCIRLLPVNP